MSGERSHKSAVLWTGGKDSALALHEAGEAGHAIDRLVTFAPANPNFLAHPIAVMRAQAQAMGLPHEVVEIGPDARAGYRDAIIRLHDRCGISTLVTGDIDLVAGLPNFVRECCAGLDVEVFMPLWNRERMELMRKIIDLKFEVILSLVKQPWFTDDWLGRRIDSACLGEMQALRDRNGLDVCGENGEYHTIVLGGPMFRQRVSLELGRPGKKEQMTYLGIKNVRLV